MVLDAIVDEVRSGKEATHIGALAVESAEFREFREDLDSIYQLRADSDGCLRAVIGDAPDDLLEPLNRLRRKDYFVAHWEARPRT